MSCAVELYYHSCVVIQVGAQHTFEGLTIKAQCLCVCLAPSHLKISDTYLINQGWLT